MLIHGLGRGTHAMQFLERQLQKAGFETHNIGYPSRELPPQEIVQLLKRKVLACCSGKSRVHFVGHSLGGLLVRALLADMREINLGRVVILGSPSQGSELVDQLVHNRLFRVLAGPTGSRLGTGKDAWPARLPKPDYELGVIAGTHSINPVGSWILEGPDDGIVSVKSTRVSGMTGFLLTPADHVLMRYSNEVADAVIRFLRTGSFRKESKP